MVCPASARLIEAGEGVHDQLGVLRCELSFGVGARPPVVVEALRTVASTVGVTHRRSPMHAVGHPACMKQMCLMC